MTGPIRVALVGYGRAGAQLHGRLLGGDPRFRVDAVVTRDPARRAAARTAFPHAQVTDQIDGCLGCDLAVVAVPPVQHPAAVRPLLRGGLHVVVEKPIAADLATAVALAATPGARQRLTVFQNRRWDSDFATLLRLRAEGSWRTPVRVTSRLGRWRPLVRDGWRNQPAGGGMLLEVGSHLVDQMLVLLGPVTRVYAELDARRAGAVAEDDVLLALTHRDGSRSGIVAGAVGDPALPRFEVTDGSMRISLGQGDPQEAQLTSGAAPRAPGWGLPDDSDWWITRSDGRPARVAASPGDWMRFYDLVTEWLAGARPPVPVGDALATARVLDAAVRSHSTGSLVDLSDDLEGAR